MKKLARITAAAFLTCLLIPRVAHASEYAYVIPPGSEVVGGNFWEQMPDGTWIEHVLLGWTSDRGTRAVVGSFGPSLGDMTLVEEAIEVSMSVNEGFWHGTLEASFPTLGTFDISMARGSGFTNAAQGGTNTVSRETWSLFLVSPSFQLAKGGAIDVSGTRQGVELEPGASCVYGFDAGGDLAFFPATLVNAL